MQTYSENAAQTESWIAEVNEDVKLWITDYTGETLEINLSRL